MDSINTSSRLRRTTGGFTLVEVMMGAAIGSIIMAGVLSTYIMTAREFRALSNYWEIHIDGRHAIDQFGLDVRAAGNVTSFAANGPLVLVVPTGFNADGSWTSTKTVTYTYSGSQGSLKRTDSSIGTSVLATNVSSLKFSLYDRVGTATTVIANSKGVVLEIFLRKYTAGQKQTEDYLSARLNMRNKP